MKEPSNLRGYRLDRPLGAGGMGSVYVAEKVSTHQTFAVKFLKEEYLEDPSYVVRFEREVAALRAIRHPHVVNVFDWSIPPAGEPEAKPFVVLELLEGEGLDRLLRRLRILPPPAAVGMMLQVLEGLAAAHAIGVIHRDLGPSNIFLVPQPGGKFLVKVLDFGLARPIVASDDNESNLTQKGTLLGKPAYIAPEMFLHGAVDARSDIYACGMILFRMLAGRLPYKESQAQMLWMERYNERNNPVERPSVRSFVPAIPEKLAMAVARALRIKPEDRYQTAEDMQVDLLEIEDSVLERAVASVRGPSVRVEDRTPTIAGPVVGLSGGPAGTGTRRGPWIGLAAVAAVAIVVTALFATGVLGGASGGSADRAAVAPGIPANAADPTDGGAALPGDPRPAGAIVPAPGADGAEAADAPASVPVVASGPDAGSAPAVPSAGAVLVVVVGAPEGAVIRMGDAVFEGVPPKARVLRSEQVAELVVEARGYQTFRKPLLLTTDSIVEVEMRRVRVVGPPRRADGGGGSMPGFPEDLPP